MTELRFPGQAPSQVARHFLELLDDVYNIHGLFQDEILALRARITDLETTTRSAGPGMVPSISEMPGCAVYLVSAEGRIQSWSGGACELYGYSVEEVVGQDPALLRPSGTQSLDSTTTTVPPVRTSHRLRKDGRAFEVYLHQTALLDEGGHVSGWMHLEVPLGVCGTASTLAARGKA